MQNQSQLPIGLFNFKNSDKNSDILSFHPSISQVDVDCFGKKQKIDQLMQNQMSVQESVTSDKAEQYFNLLFSPRVVAEYLIRRNQYLEIKCLQNQDSEPQEIYHKRKQRVQNLQQKQKKNWEVLNNIKNKQPEKYKAIKNFMQLLGDVKLRLNGIRHDYYSQKTFLTLKKASFTQISQITKILSQILTSVFQYPQKNSYNKQEKGIDQRYIQFLIIPRFFISKQKLVRFIKDYNIQQSFKFLIYHGCLGHYNNEANKKFPQQNQMKFVRVLLQEQDGRQRFKRICSINHGGKFYSKFGDLYFQLYSKTLQCLKNVDQICKKPCTQTQIKKQFAKIYKKQPKKQQPEIINYFNQNTNKSQIFNIGQIKSNYLDPENLIEYKQLRMMSKSTTQMKNSMFQSGAKDNQQIKSNFKCNVRRQLSIQFQPENVICKIKRWNTLDTAQAMQKSRQQNIIIIAPPPLHNFLDQFKF